MKIVVLDGYTENPGDLSWEGLEALGTLTVYDRTPGDKVIERIADAQAVYTNKTPITGETIEKCANMKFIGVLATGYNVIDIKAARSANVVVFQYTFLRNGCSCPVCCGAFAGALPSYWRTFGLREGRRVEPQQGLVLLEASPGGACRQDIWGHRLWTYRSEDRKNSRGIRNEDSSL